MEVKLIQTQLIELARIENNDGQIEGVKRNPRTISEADMEKLKKSLQDHPDMTALRELVVYPHGDKFVVLGGNMRLRAMRMLGYKDAPCKVIPIETPTEQLNAFIVIDNGDFGAWDWDALANEWDDLPLGDWGVPAWPSAEDDGSLLGDSKDLQNPYSTKLESPIYEIRGERPDEGDIVDTKKVDELLAEIKAAKIPEKVKTMLRVCAYRHAVIDFEGMAEYYAHAPKEVQQLMENSALVIIDFDKAVESGFVKMTADLQEIYDKNTAALYGTE